MKFYFIKQQTTSKQIYLTSIYEIELRLIVKNKQQINLCYVNGKQANYSNETNLF